MTLGLIEPPKCIDAAGPDSTTVRPLMDSWTPTRLEEGRDLFLRDQEACPLQHPDVIRAECGGLLPARLVPLSIENRHAGELIGAAALLPKATSLKQLAGFGPRWEWHGYRLAGGRCLLDHVEEANEARLLHAALQAVGDHRADFLLIEDLDRSSGLWQRLDQELPCDWTAFEPHACQARLRIEFPDDADGYWNRFSGKTRSSFRRKLKRCGVTRLERITAANEVPGFLAAAHLISLDTWQTRQFGLRVRNDDAERAWLGALAEAGLLRCYLWRIAGEPAAFCIGNQAHGRFHYEEVGYATRFARLSPGQLLIVRMIDDLIAHDPPRWFDFGGGDAEYKRLFANRVSQSGNVWLIPPSLKARWAMRWITCCGGLRQSARRTASALGLATKARQWIRQGGRKSATTDHGEPQEEGNSP